MKNKYALFIVILTLILGFQLNAQDQIIIKYADNLPDRQSGWGLVLSQVFSDFEKEHPGVKINVESSPDQQHQEKIKYYAATGKFPDIVKWWSYEPLMKPLIDSGLLLSLNPDNFGKSKFFAGVLNGNTYNNKLYGIPASGEILVIYYDKILFDRYKLSIPATFDDLIYSAQIFKKNKIIPICTDGKDSQTLNILFYNLVQRYSGDFTLPKKALDRKIKFTDPQFFKAALLLQRMMKEGVFSSELINSDKETSRNLFGQGKAGMYITSSMDLNLATDKKFSSSIRNNMKVCKIPAIKGGRGNINDLFAWYNSNFIVNSKTRYPILCAELLQDIAKNIPVILWQKKLSYPPFKITLDNNSSDIAKDLIRIGSMAKSTSDADYLDFSTPAFKDESKNYLMDFLNGITTAEEFLKNLDSAAEKNGKL